MCSLYYMVVASAPVLPSERTFVTVQTSKLGMNTAKSETHVIFAFPLSHRHTFVPVDFTAPIVAPARSG